MVTDDNDMVTVKGSKLVFDTSIIEWYRRITPTKRGNSKYILIPSDLDNNDIYVFAVPRGKDLAEFMCHNGYVTCKNCMAKINTKSRFCSECGQKI